MTMVYLQELLNSIIQSTYSDLVYKSEEENSHMAYSLSKKAGVDPGFQKGEFLFPLYPLIGY